MQYAPPFTFLTLRFAFGMLLVIPIALVVRPRWPDSPAQWVHVAIAGLLMHAVNLGGSHYAQYLGMSAGIAALVLALQPLVTAVVAEPFIGERLNRPAVDRGSAGIRRRGARRLAQNRSGRDERGVAGGRADRAGRGYRRHAVST